MFEKILTFIMAPLFGVLVAYGFYRYVESLPTANFAIGAGVLLVTATVVLLWLLGRSHKSDGSE